MLNLPGGLKVFVATEPTDMRRSHDGLSMMVNALRHNPTSGDLFVFFNKHCNRVKILYWERTGFSLWYKRLEDGVFRPPCIHGKIYPLSIQELTLLLEGIDLTTKRTLSTVSSALTVD